MSQAGSNGRTTGGSGSPVTLTPNSGMVVTEVGGNINDLGAGSIETVGLGDTITTQLTGLTNHALLVGAGTSTITKVGPDATAGRVLQSAGLSADPAFSTATYPSTAGTATNVMVSDGTNFISQTNTTAGASLVLVSMQTASNSATIDFINISQGTYRKYLLLFRAVRPVTNGASLRMQMSNNNGVSWTATGYQAGVNVNAWNSATITNINSTTDYVLTGTIDNSSAQFSAMGQVTMLHNTANIARIFGQSCYENQATSATEFANIFGKAGANGTTAYRVLMDSGDILSGIFYLFGIAGG